MSTTCQARGKYENAQAIAGGIHILLVLKTKLRLRRLGHIERRGYIRCVDYQAVPLSLDVIFRWLFSDIQAVKLQLPSNFFFPFENHQRDLGVGGHWSLRAGFLIKNPLPSFS